MKMEKRESSGFDRVGDILRSEKIYKKKGRIKL